MTPTEMHIDALMEKIEKLEAENAQLKEEKKQWEPEWFSQAAANAAGYNQALMEIKKLEAENAKYREALFYISEASWKDYPRLSDALDGGYLGDHNSEIATEALKGE